MPWRVPARGSGGLRSPLGSSPPLKGLGHRPWSLPSQCPSSHWGGEGGRQKQRKERKKKKKEGKERKGKTTTKSNRDSALSEELTTRQGPLDKSTGKAIAMHTTKPVIEGGGDGPGPQLIGSSYLCNRPKLVSAEGPTAAAQLCQGPVGQGALGTPEEGAWSLLPGHSSPRGAGPGNSHKTCVRRCPFPLKPCLVSPAQCLGRGGHQHRVDKPKGHVSYLLATSRDTRHRQAAKSASVRTPHPSATAHTAKT